MYFEVKWGNKGNEETGAFACFEIFPFSRTLGYNRTEH